MIKAQCNESEAFNIVKIQYMNFESVCKVVFLIVPVTYKIYVNLFLCLYLLFSRLQVYRHPGAIGAS